MKNYYAFLDIVIDVFYSIILYNSFISFPGFNLNSLLMLLAIFVMLNYWWVSRSVAEIPKYYLIDLYFISLIMFIFSQWANYFNDFRSFLYVMSIFWIADSAYSFTLLFAHTEKAHKNILKFTIAAQLLLALIYFILTLVISELNILSILLIYIPYVIYFIVSYKKGIIQNKFIDSGNQPY